MREGRKPTLYWDRKGVVPDRPELKIVEPMPAESAPSGFTAAPPAPHAYHSPGTDTPGHRCEERIKLKCAGCLQEIVCCDVSGDDFRAFRRRRFRCPPCRVGAS